MSVKRILIATRNADLRAELRLALGETHSVDEAEASDVLATESLDSWDLLILGSPLTGSSINGFCRSVRSRSNIPVMVIGERCGTAVIDALNAGGDEYIALPFVISELTARVRALLRRVICRERQEIVLQDRAIDMDAHKVNGPEGQVSSLTPKEYLVLRYLVEHANKPRTHRELAQTIWQRDGNGEVEYVRIVIQQLRRKLEPNPSRPRYIVTERSVGYRFQIPLDAGALALTA